MVASSLSVLIAPSAAAAATVELTQDLPTAPVQVTVGDVINLTLPRVNIVAPPGYDGGGAHSYPLPLSSDSDVLPRASGSYDADGTLHAQFQAAKAGTATISVPFPSAVFCRTSSTTTSSTSATSTQSTPITSTTSPATTSTATTASPSPTPINQCIVTDPIIPKTVTVNVSASGVSAVTVPAAGSAGSPAAGLGVALLGFMAAGGSLVAVISELHRRRR